MDQQQLANEVRPLTGLRFVAAFVVFIFHIHIRWPLTDNPYLANLVSQGAVGMTVFFVLSGYILAHTYARRATSAVEFYRNRFARIYPVYIAAALLSLPWLLVQLDDPSLLVNLARAVVVLGTSALMIQAWFPQLFGYLNHSGSWSLSVEMFFYLLFPALSKAISGLSGRNLYAFTFIVWGLSVLPGFVYAVFVPRPEYSLQLFYVMPIFRLPEFVFGICTFFVVARLRKAAWLGWAAGTLSCLLLAYLTIVGGRLPLFVTHNWIVVPTVATVIGYLATGKGVVPSILSSSVAVWAGKISYCFYSFQFVVLATVMYFREALPDSSILLGALALLALTALSWLGYILIEEPMRIRLRTRRPPPVPRV